MKILKCENDRIKIFNHSIFKIKNTHKKIKFYFFGLKIFAIKKLFYDIKLNLSNKETSFNTQQIDAKIAKEVCNFCDNLRKTPQINHNHIAYLASEIYDMGGHTECIKNIVSAMPKEYKQNLFLTRIDASKKNAPQKYAEILKYAKISGIEQPRFNDKYNILSLFKQLTEFAPKSLLVFIHMNDAFGTALLVLIKKYTNIKIIYSNHGSHWPSLGMSFADLIWEGMPTTTYVTQKYRGFNNTCVLGLPYLKEEDLPVFTSEEIKQKRIEIGVPDDCLCTMSGASSYKFFDNEEKSDYFEMIYSLLKKHKNLYHVIITNMSIEENNVITKIFNETEIKSRLIILPNTPAYKLLFKCCDVFVDSFPVSSALTQVDLMSLNVPTVVKINKENALWSFHEYMPKDYPYMFEKVLDMQQGIEKLLQNKEEQQKVIDMNYKHFLSAYEGKTFCKKLIDIMNLEDYSTIYDQPIKDGAYNLKDMR